MRVFVSGATGFLGVNLARFLVERGHFVRLLVRPRGCRTGLTSSLMEFVEGDVTDAASVLRAMRSCDEAYHLAAWVQITPWDGPSARRVNVEGTRHVCEAALRVGVRRLVHTSSIATIATGSPDAPATEDSPWNLDGIRIPYYETKKEAERVVEGYVRRGLDAVIVNPTYLVGPWDVKPTSGRMLIHVATGRLRFYPSRGGINYVDVRQAASGHLLAMQFGRTGERYILGGENLAFRDYLHRVARIAGVAPPRLPLSYAGMWPFAAAGSCLGRLLPGWFRDVNLCMLRSACLEHYVSSDKARRELGYTAGLIDQAIRDAIDWFVEHGYLRDRSGRFAPAAR